MKARLALSIIALLTGACGTSTTEPASAPSLTAPETRASLQRVNATRLYPKSASTNAPKNGLALFAESSEAQNSGYYGQRCTLLDRGVRCSAYWVGAYLTTTVGVGTCIGSIGLACAGGILVTGYAWDVWASYRPEPPPINRGDPWKWNW